VGTLFLTRELSLASPSYNSHELKQDSSLETVASGVAMGGGVWWEWPLFVFPDSSWYCVNISHTSFTWLFVNALCWDDHITRIVFLHTPQNISSLSWPIYCGSRMHETMISTDHQHVDICSLTNCGRSCTPLRYLLYSHHCKYQANNAYIEAPGPLQMHISSS